MFKTTKNILVVLVLVSVSVSTSLAQQEAQALGRNLMVSSLPKKDLRAKCSR